MGEGGGGVARALEMSDNMSMVHKFLCDNFFVCFSNSKGGRPGHTEHTYNHYVHFTTRTFQ